MNENCRIGREPAIPIRIAMLQLPHDPRLARLIMGYWYVEDLAGLQAGSPIETCPFPGAVLSVSIGRLNGIVDGPLVPRVGLLGVQERRLFWRSWEDTAFFMAFLTPEGLASLFPDTGASTCSALVDVGALLGDSAEGLLLRDVSSAPTPAMAALRLDAWLLGRLDTSPPGAEVRRTAAAALAIAAGSSVNRAATMVGTTRRQLHRWHMRHFGLGPARLGQLTRLQESVWAVQDGGDGMAGFADQPHQVRSWNARLGITPGLYRRQSRTRLATLFDSGTAGLSFYL